jgi:addiction module RelB/DinJ family antitoxin
MPILSIQLDKHIQEEVSAVLNAQGLSITDVVLMTLKQIAEEKRLPTNLATALAQKVKQIDSSPSGEDLTCLPAFGMWADRQDMENPTEWVQKLRRGRYRDF